MSTAMNSTPLILQHAFEQAQRQAQTVEEHGKAFERMAKSLEGRMLAPEQAAAIEQAGQQIQQHGKTMAALVELALHNERYWLEEYTKVHQQQLQAVLLYIKSIQVILQATQSLL